MYLNVIRIVDEFRVKGINVALPTGKEEEGIVSVENSSANRYWRKTILLRILRDNGHELDVIEMDMITQLSVWVSEPSHSNSFTLTN